MYSAVVLGCEHTTINPRRVMSTPTEIMFEASTTSTGSRFLSFTVNERSSRALASFTWSVVFREVSSSQVSWMRRSESFEVVSPALRRSEARSRRARTSSSTIRWLPPSSRSELKYPTSVMYGSAASGLSAKAFCAAPRRAMYDLISKTFWLLPGAARPT